MKQDLTTVFSTSKLAYRLVDNNFVVAIGTNEQADAYVDALSMSYDLGALGARKHLIQAGKLLRGGDWSGSVRESIHAVETVVVHLAKDGSTLGKALRPLEGAGLLNKQMKSALEKLYAYTNSEDGVRHANVFGDENVKVDEIDALFMLGACASFVSFLLSKNELLVKIAPT